MTVCVDVSKSKTKLHLGQGPNCVRIRDQITFESGTKSGVCVSVSTCMKAFESKTKLHLDQGSNHSWIWNQFAFGFRIQSECVLLGDYVQECI